MEDDWQKLAEDDAPPAPKAIPAVVNKWAGEDEEEDIKDSWDADEDEEKKDEEKAASAQSSKPKKTAPKKLSEKEKQKLEQEEKRRKEKEEEDLANMTPEERAAEKLRLKLLQEESDTIEALDTLGLTSAPSGSGLESFNPKTDEQFKDFADAITKLVTHYKARKEYVPFMEDLLNKLCAGLSSTNLRKIKGNIEKMAAEQQKMEKEEKPKKKAAGKVKVSLRMEGDDDYNSRVGAYEADDYDDFM